ncbi:MAG: hypothetical protein FWF92_01895 [Oscillospiraceae bacterium]|nr:hypothetical protein [Oscillospiraceae bacterium]
MNIISLLDNKNMKPLEKRVKIVEIIRMNFISIKEIKSLQDTIDDKKMALIFEAMEDVTNKNPEIANLDWLIFVQNFILSKSNNLKREASRIVGNIAYLFPNNLNVAIQNLIENTKNESTVIRWGSAYALARIIQIPKYANNELYAVIEDLCEQETDNGVKNQFTNGLKKAEKIRKA